MGREDPDTLESQYRLAWVLSELKRYEEAETLHRETWQTRQRVLGQEDRDTLWSQYRLAWVLGSLNRYEEAETLYRDIWQTKQRVLGREDRDTLKSQFELAWVSGKLKRYEEAEALDWQTWQIRRRLLGDNSLETLESLLNLSSSVFCLEKYALALELGRDLLSKIVSLPPGERREIEEKGKCRLAECLFENGYDHEAEKVLHDTIQEGIIDDTETESIMKWYLRAITRTIHSPDSPLPWMDADLLQSTGWLNGKRISKMIGQLSPRHKDSDHLELRDTSLQETSSVVISEESQSFINGLVSRADSSITSIETEIHTIQNVSMSLTGVASIRVDLV